MYHDQALIPIKTLAFDEAVNITLGLPFVRTSPDHGTALSLAGNRKARATSLIAALKMADALSRCEAPALRKTGAGDVAAAPGRDCRARSLSAQKILGTELPPRPEPDAAHRARGDPFPAPTS